MPSTVKNLETARDTETFWVARSKPTSTLHRTIKAVCAADQRIDSARTIERNRHGRQEHRLVETFDLTGRLGADWDGLIVAAARVTRLTWHKDTATGFWVP
ncbi:MAG: hypothetical protein U1E35_05040 [Rhodospirillales bacterium]